MPFWSGAGGGVLSGGGSILGSLVGGYFAKKSDSAANRRQLYMMQNAHQMEVEDLRKAGLNPILSAGGSGASSFSAQSTGGSSAMSGAATGAKVGALAAGELKLMEAQADAARANAAAALASRDETKRRTEVEYGRPGSVGAIDPKTGKRFPGEARDVGLREREVIANVQLLEQRAREAGFSNVRAAQEAKLYEDFPMVMPLEKLLDAYERLGGKNLTLPRKGK